MEINAFIDNVASQFDGADRLAFRADAEFRGIDGWSSLVALSIIAMADEEYGVALRGDDIRSARTIQDLFNVVRAKRGE